MNDESWNERGPVAESAVPMPGVTDRAARVIEAVREEISK